MVKISQISCFFLFLFLSYTISSRQPPTPPPPQTSTPHSSYTWHGPAGAAHVKKRTYAECSIERTPLRLSVIYNDDSLKKRGYRVLCKTHSAQLRRLPHSSQGKLMTIRLFINNQRWLEGNIQGTILINTAVWSVLGVSARGEPVVWRGPWGFERN